MKSKIGGVSMRKAKKATKKKAAPKRKVAKKKAAPMKKAVKKIRCAAKTKAGKRCKRFTNGKAKFCSLHKKR